MKHERKPLERKLKRQKHRKKGMGKRKTKKEMGNKWIKKQKNGTSRKRTRQMGVSARQTEWGKTREKNKKQKIM